MLLNTCMLNVVGSAFISFGSDLDPSVSAILYEPVHSFIFGLVQVSSSILVMKPILL